MTNLIERFTKSCPISRDAPSIRFPNKITYFIGESIEGGSGEEAISIVLTLINSGYSVVAAVVDSRSAAKLSNRVAHCKKIGINAELLQICICNMIIDNSPANVDESNIESIIEILRIFKPFLVIVRGNIYDVITYAIAANELNFPYIFDAINIEQKIRTYFEKSESTKSFVDTFIASISQKADLTLISKSFAIDQALDTKKNHHI